MLRFIISLPLMLIFRVVLIAQPAGTVQMNPIEPYRISIAADKTSNLIFPYAIKSVDRGTPAILAQKAHGIDNVLQVKAETANFETTNLSIVTSDGHFYSFLVSYSPEPAMLNVSMVGHQGTAQPLLLTGQLFDEATFNASKDSVLASRRFLHRSVSEQLVKLQLTRIYLFEKAMWFGLKLLNRSLIDYSPYYFRFLIVDKKRGKRTARQEFTLSPAFSTAGTTTPGDSTTNYVFVFNPFTIPLTKELVIQVSEQNGGRTLDLHIPARVITRARKLD